MLNLWPPQTRPGFTKTIGANMCKARLANSSKHIQMKIRLTTIRMYSVCILYYSILYISYQLNSEELYKIEG